MHWRGLLTSSATTAMPLTLAGSLLQLRNSRSDASSGFDREANNETE
jgi:hypothetical protein